MHQLEEALPATTTSSASKSWVPLLHPCHSWYPCSEVFQSKEHVLPPFYPLRPAMNLTQVDAQEKSADMKC